MEIDRLKQEIDDMTINAKPAKEAFSCITGGRFPGGGRFRF
jgi:hypothetical protein